MNPKNRYPILWDSLPTPSYVNEALLLDGYWAPNHGGYTLLLYDTLTNQLVRWVDRNARPKVFVTDQPQDWMSDYPMLKTTYYDSLAEKDVDIWEVVISKERYRFDNKLSGMEKVNTTIDIDQQYFYYEQLTPGILVSIQDNALNFPELAAADIRSRLVGEPEEVIQLAEMNMPILEQPIPQCLRAAFDIEVKGPRGIFPLPENAEFSVHAIAIYDNQGKSHMFMLGFPPLDKEKWRIIKELNPQLKNEQVDAILGGDESIPHQYPIIHSYIDEGLMLQDFFELIITYPIVMSFNGDNFDMPYLMNRAKKLGIKSPIHVILHDRWKTKYHFVNSFHIDLFRFFANSSVRLYAYGGKYSRLRLNDIAEALLGVTKVEHDLWYDEMTRDQMVAYTVRDVELTLKLTTYSNNLTWQLIIILMRVGKLTLDDVIRKPISRWILNWICYEHIREKQLIPSRKQLIKSKGGFKSKAEIDGKQYQGAIVLDGKAGVYWDVTVADYASLYPSVIKKYRLSYETILCGHHDCVDNPYNNVPELDHYVCTHRMGIIAALVGYVRDIRVNWYKDKSTDKQVDKVERDIAHTIQQALKVFINASYGVLGNKNFPFFCPPVAESTTAYARYALLQAKQMAEDKGMTVVYGDTDSIFLHNVNQQKFNYIHLWSIIDLGIPLGIDYKFIFLVLSGRKKNYFGVTEDGKMIVKGLQVKKSNTALFIQETFATIKKKMEGVKNKRDLDDAKMFMITSLQQAKESLTLGQVPIAKLAKQATIKMGFEQYQALTPAVQIALQEMTEDNKEEYVQGSQFMIVKTKKREIVSQTNMVPKYPKGTKVKVNYMSVNRAQLSDIDWKPYIQQLKRAFIPILDAFDLEWDKTVNQTGSIEELDWYFEQEEVRKKNKALRVRD